MFMKKNKNCSGTSFLFCFFFFVNCLIYFMYLCIYVFSYSNLLSGVLWLGAVIIFLIDGECYDYGVDELEDEDEIEYTWGFTLYLSLLAAILHLVIGGTQTYGRYRTGNAGGTGNESLINNDGNDVNNENIENNTNNNSDGLIASAPPQ